MFTSILVFLSLVLVFVLLLALFAYEQKKGGRIYASSMRQALDRGGIYLTNKLKETNSVLSRFVFSLTWRRLVHFSLRNVLSVIANFYEILVNYFEYNHKKTRSLKKAKKAWQQGDTSYLGKVSEHKQQSKLTVQDKKARKQKALEG